MCFSALNTGVSFVPRQGHESSEVARRSSWDVCLERLDVRDLQLCDFGEIPIPFFSQMWLVIEATRTLQKRHCLERQREQSCKLWCIPARLERRAI